MKLIEGNLSGTELPDAIRNFTDFDVVSTGAILDAKNLTSIAICTASRYNYTKHPNAYDISCEDYDNAQCKINDYLTVQANRKNFCPAPTASPQPSLSPSPTWKWDWKYPTWNPYPTGSPTSSYQPTQSPYPTWSPTSSYQPTQSSYPTWPRSCYYSGREHSGW